MKARTLTKRGETTYYTATYLSSCLWRHKNGKVEFFSNKWGYAISDFDTKEKIESKRKSIVKIPVSFVAERWPDALK